MIDSFLETGLYLLGVVVVPLVGVLLVCRGLFGDRSKGRPRCSKCWYDMRGTVPGLVCPECGHDAGLRHKLYQDRVDTRLILLGLVAILIGLILYRVAEGISAGEYLIGIVLVSLIGLLLACCGLWGDPSRRRARCPKCWRNMSGTLPRLVCPDCGHDAGEKRLLYQGRRRWGLVVLGAVLVYSALIFLWLAALALPDVFSNL